MQQVQRGVGVNTPIADLAVEAKERTLKEKGLHVFYGPVGTYGPCSCLDCTDNTSGYVLAITTGKNRYFNLCPTHEGLLLEKLIGGYLKRLHGDNPRKVGVNRELVVRFTPEELLKAQDAILAEEVVSQHDWE